MESVEITTDVGFRYFDLSNPLKPADHLLRGASIAATTFSDTADVTMSSFNVITYPHKLAEDFWRAKG